MIPVTEQESAVTAKAAHALEGTRLEADLAQTGKGN
jgi:hypothetical protein